MSTVTALDRSLTLAQGQVPDCVAAGLVDLSTGMLLAVKTVDSHPQEVLDLVAAATAELFQGTNVRAIEEMFKKQRGVTDSAHYFQEIVVFSTNLIHVFLRGRGNTDHVLVVVCRGSANIGMVLSKARGALASVEKGAA